MSRVSHIPDRPEYPEYRERFGEDPARFLFSEFDDLGPRIHALETVELVRAWLDVETNRDEPRPEIVAALNKRQRELQDGDADAGTGDVKTEGTIA